MLACRTLAVPERERGGLPCSLPFVVQLITFKTGMCFVFNHKLLSAPLPIANWDAKTSQLARKFATMTNGSRNVLCFQPRRLPSYASYCGFGERRNRSSKFRVQSFG